ncbi:histamine H2 receptor-like [Mya arenaria]|uniref:histamine H2 receptor-like n=1 Tax=Mya arenaria TaxID=6604 RepID=UPI0022E1F46B|nr:histamine H2 receptor-like [Mya arenaria]XP_052767339.1 histamine H2 receptor-like [Mya arenaria]
MPKNVLIIMTITQTISLTDNFNSSSVYKTDNMSSPDNLKELVQESTLFTTLHGYKVTFAMLVIGLVMAILGSVIILLNSVLLHTLAKCRHRLDVTDRFIRSLAISDLIIGILLLYNTVYNILNFQNRYECLSRMGLIHAMMINSTGHISLLTINRFIKVIQPLRYLQIFKKWRIILLSVSVWCVSLIIGSLPLLGWNKTFEPEAFDDNQITVCRYFGIMQPGYIILNICLFWLPLMLMAVMYTKMCQITLRHQRAIVAQVRSIQRTQPQVHVHEGNSWRFTKTVLTVVGAYFFCWLPAGTYFIIQISGGVDHLSYETQGNILTFVTGFGFFNSALNPLIYATKIPSVKRRFQKFFCCRKPRRDFSVAIYSCDNVEALSSQRKGSLECERT